MSRQAKRSNKRGKRPNCLYPMRTKYHRLVNQTDAKASPTNRAARKRAAVIERVGSDRWDEMHVEANLVNELSS